MGEDVFRVSSLLEFWRRSAEVRNTLDKPESRLSARLPGIMDVTVTHVNEARHLHLPHYHLLPRRAFDGCGEETSTSSCCVSFDPNRPPFSHRQGLTSTKMNGEDNWQPRLASFHSIIISLMRVTVDYGRSHWKKLGIKFVGICNSRIEEKWSKTFHSTVWYSNIYFYQKITGQREYV